MAAFACFSVSLFQRFKVFQLFHAVSVCFSLFHGVSVCFSLFQSVSLARQSLADVAEPNHQSQDAPPLTG